MEKKYGILPSNRDVVIKNLIATLTHGDYEGYTVENIDLFIIRTDIKNFYPSVNKHHLYRRLMNANMLSNDTLKILKSMFFSSAVFGIPLGLPFSSALAEIYLEKFDEDIYQRFNPAFYFRYVDDIIIISYNTLVEIDEKVEEQKLKAVFKDNFLKINEHKTTYNYYFPKRQVVKELCFDYLGYNFKTENNTLNIAISQKKYKKITNRIKKYFYLFKMGNQSDKQFWLLYYRLMNSLYGITSLDANKKKLHFGLGFSYRFVNDKNQISRLLTMIRGLIHSCRLSPKKRSHLFYLISTKESSLDILKKRFDYTSLTSTQVNIIKGRLQMTTDSVNINRIFHGIYK